MSYTKTGAAEAVSHALHMKIRRPNIIRMSELGWWIVATTVRPVFASVRKVTTTDSAVKLSRLYRLATGKSQPQKNHSLSLPSGHP